jgi:hypothetical protein
MQSLVGENRLGWEESIESETGMFVAGAIVDSWVESARPADGGVRVVLQVVPRGHPVELVIIETDASLVPDQFWLADLSENLCHGSPVLAIGSLSSNGLFAATWLQLAR